MIIICILLGIAMMAVLIIAEDKLKEAKKIQREINQKETQKQKKKEDEINRELVSTKCNISQLEEKYDKLLDKIYNKEEELRNINWKIIDARRKLQSVPMQHYLSSKDSIVGIDFEYLITGRHDTPCQIGLVKVIDGVIVLRYSSLIHVSSTIEGSLTYGNGITREMTYKAPWFSDVIKVIESICQGATIVAHNKSTEKTVLKKACELHKIDSWLTKVDMVDTCKLMGGKGLQECCAEHNIPLNHHDALSDAEACAKLYLIHNGRKVVEEQVRVFGKGSTVDNSTSDVYKPLSDDQVENKNTPFFGGVKTVVTGTFTNFPDRAVLKEKLKALGADIDTTVTKRTKILVTGSGCGPKKLETAQGYGVRIMNETEVLKYIQ